MVSIQGFGLPISRSKNAKLRKSEKSSASVETPKLETVKPSGSVETPTPSVIAKAVAQGIRSADFVHDPSEHLHYDLPDGKSRQALEAYLTVKHQAKRDALMALFGVDLFI